MYRPNWFFYEIWKNYTKLKYRVTELRYFVLKKKEKKKKERHYLNQRISISDRISKSKGTFLLVFFQTLMHK